MKRILSITLGLIIMLGFSSCDKWLDVNVDPDNPNDLSATPEIRLPGYSITTCMHRELQICVRAPLQG